MEARDLSNRDDEPDQARDEKPQAAFDGQDDARDHDRAHAQPNQKSEKKLHARDVTWLSDSFKPAYGLDVLPASPGARPAAKKRAGRIQEERGQLCPRGCRLKLLELCGQGCPRSFRVILESTLGCFNRSLGLLFSAPPPACPQILPKRMGNKPHAFGVGRTALGLFPQASICPKLSVAAHLANFQGDGRTA